MRVTQLARIVVAFLVSLAGLVFIAGWCTATSWCWPLYLLVGVVAGAIVRRGRDIWVVPAAAAALYPVAAWLGLPREEVFHKNPDYWIALTLVGACLATAGYAVGALLAGWVGRSRSGASSTGSAGTIGWPLFIGAVALGLAGLGAWVAYSAAEGSRELIASEQRWPDCATPAFRYGWDYQAVNYDKADDARLEALYPDMKACKDRGSTAGDEILTSDRVPIAGWYIPAANGIGPTGPTIVIVPGWKSHKAEVLKYAPPFHETYNLLLLDLRNQGRSGGGETTWGLLERRDVRAVIDWLERTRHPTWIGAMGNSMGAATALAEAAEDPRVEALILDSMHASLVSSWTDGLEGEQHLPGMPTGWVIVMAASARIGMDLTSVDPERMIGRVGDRPVLLIHSRFDILDRPERSADVNAEAARKAGVAVELHYCEVAGKGHGHVIDDCQRDWTAWASDFLAAARAP